MDGQVVYGTGPVGEADGLVADPLALVALTTTLNQAPLSVAVTVYWLLVAPTIAIVQVATFDEVQRIHW
jgi:hypothetical protein